MKHFQKHTVATLVQLAVLLLLSGCLDNGEPSARLSDTGAANGGSAGDNQAPIMSGTPTKSTKFGETYSFTPTTEDPDGDSLLFKVQNLPRWASFNRANGTIYGTPDLGDVGTYPSILISVSDGLESAWLPPFAVDVTQTATGSTTLSWAAPTLNTDGSPLADLHGYNIYYGLSVGDYRNQIQIDNPGITMYVVDNLSPNTYYFVMTSINAIDVESGYSNVITRSVN